MFLPQMNRWVCLAAVQGIRENSGGEAHAAEEPPVPWGGPGGVFWVVGQCLGFPILGQYVAQGSMLAKLPGSSLS